MKNIIQLLLISIIIISCKNKIDCYQIGSDCGTKLDEIIKFDSTDDLSVEADDTTITPINVNITKNASVNNRTVKFKTTLGHFINDSSTIDVIADANGNVYTELLNPKKIGTGIISAEIKGVIRTRKINCTPSQPEYLQIFTDNINYLKNDTITVNTKLYKQKGNVSNNIRVAFEYKFPEKDSVLLNYDKFVYCNNQNCTTSVNILDIKSATKLTITAFCLVKSDTIKAEKIVYINP